MAVESVRLILVTADLTPAYVNSVSVRVFSANGLLLTSGVSGETSPGVVDFDLPGELLGVEYQLRFYKAGTIFRPKRIVVYSPESAAPMQSNEFTVTGEVFGSPPADNPLMCRASGLLIGPTGRPKKTLTVTFLPKFNAFVAGEAAALTGRFVTHTDANGFLSVDLYRFGQYTVIVEGREAVTRNIEVPNRASISLSRLLFPVVEAVTYENTQPLTVARGASISLLPHVRSSDGRDLGVGHEDVQYEALDPTIASVQILGDHVIVRGLRAGTTAIRVTRADNSIVYLPDLGIAGGEVPLVVT